MKRLEYYQKLDIKKVNKKTYMERGGYDTDYIR